MLRIISTILLISFFISTSVVPVAAAINYTYDANGNMTSDGTRCFEYDDANQLKKVKSCGNNQTIAEYLYDHNGKRIVKKEFENGTLKHTIYSPTDEYETKKFPVGTTQNTTYYKVNDEVVAKKNPDGTINYFHNDHLGSTSVLTNQSGQVVEKTSYEPYGEVKAGGTKSKWGYTGQEKDSETGLNYYDARYYDPHIHRFTQPDEIIHDPYNPQDLNRYAYVRNNPLKYTDPTGNIPLLAIALVGGILGAGAGYAEVRLSNPDATFTDYAKGMGVGFVAGAGATALGIVAAAATTTALAGTTLSTGAVTATANISGGIVSSVAGNAVHNASYGKDAFADAHIAAVSGGVLGYATGGIANQLVPAGRGAVPKLNFSVSANAGPNTFRVLERNTIDIGLNNLATLPMNVNSAKNKNTKSAFDTFIDNVSNFFKPKQSVNTKKN